MRLYSVYGIPRWGHDETPEDYKTIESEINWRNLSEQQEEDSSLSTDRRAVDICV